MPLTDMLLLVAAGFAAGGMNALAGGGTFFSFPALLATGLPPVTANATNAVALWPASLAGAWAARSTQITLGVTARLLGARQPETVPPVAPVEIALPTPTQHLAGVP